MNLMAGFQGMRYPELLEKILIAACDRYGLLRPRREKAVPVPTA